MRLVAKGCAVTFLSEESYDFAPGRHKIHRLTLKE